MPRKKTNQKTTPGHRSHSAIALTYVEDVLAGRILASQQIKQACQRHLEDLKRSESPEFPYRFDSEKADRVCKFMELLPHTKGKWASKRETLRLEPWQCFLTVSLMGWVWKSDGLRRFRRAYICVARKNGKSIWAAALGMWMLCCDAEAGAEVYSAATGLEQAKEIFTPAKLMAERTPELQSRLGIQVNAESLIRVSDFSRFVPIIGRARDGSSPSAGFLDEYHQAISAEVHDALITGMGARQQPLMMVITTAGATTQGPCHQLQQEAEQVLAGLIENDELFAAIYTLDPDDDWSNPDLLIKANPNLGISIEPKWLLARHREAITNSAKQNNFRTKHCNQWVTASQTWLNAEALKKCADPKLDPEQFLKDPCWLGSDLASKLDLAATVRLHRRDIDGKPHYYCFCRPYLPEAQVDQPGNQHYQKWSHDGHLTATDGSSIDYSTLEADATEDIKKFQVKELAYDARYADQYAQRLNQLTGVVIVETPPSPLILSPAMKELEAAVMDGRFHYDCNPVMTWCLANVMTRETSVGNYTMPEKARPEYKIDCAVACFIAMARARLAPIAASTWTAEVW